MARTIQQQLDAVDAKLAEIEAGTQSATIDDNQYNEALYRDLTKERDRLQQKLHRSKGGWTRKWQ